MIPVHPLILRRVIQRQLLSIPAALTIFVVFYLYLPSSSFGSPTLAEVPNFLGFIRSKSSNTHHNAGSGHACAYLPGVDDVLVTMKTGATEIHRKLPIHFATTFQCIPHYGIFSDMTEDLGPYHVYDILEDVDESVKQSSEDFDLYRRLHDYQEKNRGVWDLSEDEKYQAWILDRWKFLPLLERAFWLKPDAKWYVFIEADSHLIWSNTLEWLSSLPGPLTNLYYLGSQTVTVGGESPGEEFAHGGSGYVLSSAALRKALHHRAQDIAKWGQITADTWIGDLVVAKLLKAVDIPLTWAWPILQGETPSTMDYTMKTWCFPVVSYHHVDVEDVMSMWNFEQSWINSHMTEDFDTASTKSSLLDTAGQVIPGSKREPIRHRDIFEHFILPEIQSEKLEWDNLSNDWEEELPAEKQTAEDCRLACQAREDCMQYLFQPGICQTGKQIRYGRRQPESQLDTGTYVSGWMTDRIMTFKDSLEPCEQKWNLSQEF